MMQNWEEEREERKQQFEERMKQVREDALQRGRNGGEE